MRSPGESPAPSIRCTGALCSEGRRSGRRSADFWGTGIGRRSGGGSTRTPTVRQCGQWAERSAEGEEDVGLKAWLLVTLGRSKRVDVAKGLGYRDGSAVTHLLKQLEAARREDRSLNRRMKKLTDAFDSRFKR